MNDYVTSDNESFKYNQLVYTIDTRVLLKFKFYLSKILIFSTRDFVPRQEI